jgi:hypothetical protein
MLVSGPGDGDHKDQSALDHPEPMQRVRFEVADGGPHAAAGTGVSMDDTSKLSSLRMKSRASFRNNDDDVRDEAVAVNVNDTRPLRRPADRRGIVTPLAEPTSTSESWRSWYAGSNSHAWNGESSRDGGSTSALAEQNHRSGSHAWQYQRPPSSYPPPPAAAAHHHSWHWPGRTHPPSAPAPAYDHRHHHYHTQQPLQERSRMPSASSSEDPPASLTVSDINSHPSSENNVNFRRPNKRSIAPTAPVLLPETSSSSSSSKRSKGFDKLDLLCSATLEIGPLQLNPAGCSCPKSKCIALYCDCFKAGRRCNPDTCSCLGCKNTIDESGAHGARTKAIRSILARNPRAFVTAGMGNVIHKLPPGEVACNCVRSRCLKLYCSCFQSGKACNENVCSCVSCLNTHADVEGKRYSAIQQCLEKRPDAFQIRTKVTGLGCACKNNRCIRKYCECFRTNLACTTKCSCLDCENNDHDNGRVVEVSQV